MRQPLGVRCYRYACALSFLAFSYAALCEHLPIRAYGTSDGLASNDVNTITLDSAGFLWFATDEGLSRFDGYEFETYGRANGLSRDRIADFLETEPGRFWAATSDGIAKFEPNAPAANKFTLYRPEGVDSRRINVLFKDRGGQVWCGTEGGLFRVRARPALPGNWQFEPAPIVLRSGKRALDHRVISLFEDRRGDLWIGTIRALYRRTRDGSMFEYQRNPPEGIDFLWNAIFQDSKDRLWAATGSGLWRIAPDGRGDYKITAVYVPKTRLIVWCIREKPGGKLWLGTSGGLVEWDPDTARAQPLRTYTEKNGLTHNEIDALAVDREGNLWLGSAGGGAMRVARNGFTTYTTADRLSLNRFSGLNVTLFRDRKGEVYVAFHHVIDALRNEKFIEITPAIPKTHDRYLGWGWHQTIDQDKSGDWWIATAKGLVRFPNVPVEALGRTRPLAVYTTRQGLRTNDIFRIFEDSRGDIWIAAIGPSGINGLSRWDCRKNSFSHFNAHSVTVATAFAEDRNGSIWIGYYDGVLAHFCNGSFTIYTPDDGLAGGTIEALHVDHSGRLWIASLRGLTRVDAPADPQVRFERFGTREGLSSNVVLCIDEDRWGRVYLATGHGIDRVDASGQITPARVKHYTAMDGLTNGDLRDVLFDSKGVLWCVSKQGVSRFTPEPDRLQEAPPVFIRQLRIRGVPFSNSGETALRALRLAPYQNQLQVDFTGLAFTPSETLRYQYKLEPADRDWSEASDQRTVNYSNIAPGNYTFLARAVTESGGVTAHPAVLSFTVMAPIWQRVWFQILVMCLLLVTLYLMLQYRARRVLELERMRTRIATDLHDDIGSELSQIAILAEVARAQSNQSDTQELTESLLKIGSTCRHVSESMSDIVWSVNPRRDRFSDLIQRMRRFSSDLFTGHNIEFRFHVTASEQEIQLAPSVRREIYLVFKEAVNNAVRHSRCTHVDIRILIDSSWFELSIEDNGRGLADEYNHDGHGLANIRERSRRIKGRLALQSGEQGGLLITLRVPLRTIRLPFRNNPPDQVGPCD